MSDIVCTHFFSRHPVYQDQVKRNVNLMMSLYGVSTEGKNCSLSKIKMIVNNLS